MKQYYKQIAIDILEEFEEFLAEKGVDIPNPEKAESDDPAILYGTDYGELEDYIATYASRLIGGLGETIFDLTRLLGDRLRWIDRLVGHYGHNPNKVYQEIHDLALEFEERDYGEINYWDAIKEFADEVWERKVEEMPIATTIINFLLELNEHGGYCRFPAVNEETVKVEFTEGHEYRVSMEMDDGLGYEERTVAYYSRMGDIDELILTIQALCGYYDTELEVDA